MAENSKSRVAVVFGGPSVEHEVSVITGIQAFNALKSTAFEPVAVYIDKGGRWFVGDAVEDLDRYKDTKALARTATEVIPFSSNSGRLLLRAHRGGIFKRWTDTAIDAALLALHGSEGENGSVQGLLETFNVPYTGSDVTASAIGMDKAIAKSLCAAAGVPVVNGVVLREHEWRGQEDARLRQCESTLGFPMIVKPCRLGSSIGIRKVADLEMLESAVEEGLRLDEKILVERSVEALREFNCSVLGDGRSAEISVVEEPVRVSGEALLSYEQKYQRGSAKGSGAKANSGQGMASLDRIIPADIPEELISEIRRLALKIFQVVGCGGVARVDFLFDSQSGQIYFNEINTIPGSFSFYLWEPSGVPFDALLSRMIEIAFDRHRRKIGKIRTYETDLLSRNALKGVKGKSG